MSSPEAESGIPQDGTDDSGAKPTPSLGEQISATAGQRVSTDDQGNLDLMASVGGIRGIAEALLPSAAFLTAFLITDGLTGAIVMALGMGAIFTLLRLLQRGSLIQSFSGLIGVVICAAFAYFSGDARGYYEPGFYINAIYIGAFVLSILLRWPLIGLLFALVRGEGVQWRADTARRRRYAAATWILVAVMASRLAVQLPLYWAENVAGLGIARLVMGVPLYAAALWVAWMITRPAPALNEGVR